jgi:hypothetical protein
MESCFTQFTNIKGPSSHRHQPPLHFIEEEYDDSDKNESGNSFTELRA